MNIPAELRQFDVVLFHLKKLHFVCSHQVLPGNYCKVIDEFSVEWYKLTDQFNISTTPKIHIILSDLCDYFDKTQLSFAKTSDDKRWFQPDDLSYPFLTIV